MSANKLPSASNSLVDWPVEWLRIASPPEVERLSAVDWDTFKRTYPDKVVKLSARRVGTRVGDALMIGNTAKK